MSANAEMRFQFNPALTIALFRGEGVVVKITVDRVGDAPDLSSVRSTCVVEGLNNDLKWFDRSDTQNIVVTTQTAAQIVLEWTVTPANTSSLDDATKYRWSYVIDDAGTPYTVIANQEFLIPSAGPDFHHSRIRTPHGYQQSR